MKTPAVIVGMDVNGLGVLRSLAGMDIPLVCVDKAPKRSGMYSRYGRKVLFQNMSGEGFVDELVMLAQGYHRKPVLFLTEEASVRSVSQYRTRLSDYYEFHMVDTQLLNDLMSKDGFNRVAEGFDAHLPRSVFLKSEEDLAQLGGLSYPCMLKPAYKDYTYGSKFKKGYKVQSPEQAAVLFKEISPIFSDLIVQEWIEGQDDAVYFCLQYRGESGNLLGSFVGRKIRSWPRQVGGTASCIAAWDEMEQVQKLTDDFFQNIGYVGMGGMEYKRDFRSGRYIMVEPTVARTDFQHEVAPINGVNLPLIQYCHEAGLSLPDIERRSPIHLWREPVDDKWASEEDPPGFRIPIQDVKVVDAYWRWKDPMPWLILLLRRLRGKLLALASQLGSPNR